MYDLGGEKLQGIIAHLDYRRRFYFSIFALGFFAGYPAAEMIIEWLLEADGFVPEGVDGRVEYKGNVSKIIYQLKGGLKSSMGYIGAKKLNDIKKNAKFIKITKAGFYESMVHSVEMIEPTLNYKL